MRAFHGKEGLGVFLGEKRRELRKVRILGEEEGSGALFRLVSDLEDVYSKSHSLGEFSISEKATQVVDLKPHIPMLCGWINVGESIFRFDFYYIFYDAEVTAKSPGWGQALQVGPYPPPPLGTFRSVYAKLTENGAVNPPGDYDSSTVYGATIEATQQIRGEDHCYMETAHVYSATCYNGSVNSAVVTVERSCTGAGSTPIITVD